MAKTTKRSAPKLKKITSLSHLRQMAEQDPRYIELACLAAKNLGGVVGHDFEKAMRWLALNGMEAWQDNDGTGLLAEINGLRPFVHDAASSANTPDGINADPDLKAFAEASAAEPENNACLSDAASVDSTTVVTPVSATTITRSSSMTITLTKRNTEKSGNTAYSQPGVRASVYFNKLMFAGAAPDTIEITAPDGAFTLPGEIKPKITSEEKLAKIKANAEKAAAAAEKAAARAAKAQAQLAKVTVQPVL